MTQDRTQQLISSRAPWPYAIEITNKCPFKCVMCARTHSMTRAVGHMSFRLFEKVIAAFDALPLPPRQRERHLLRLHDFGESLVHPEFDRFIRHAAGKGFKTALSINPLMLTEPVTERLLTSGISKLFCSLDGHDDASFEAIRGVPDAWEVSVRRLDHFLKRRAELGTDVHVELSMIDFAANRESIAKARARWENHPLLDEFRHKVFMRWDGADETVNALSDPDSGEQSDALRGRRGACREPWKAVVVLWDGRVVPCCFDYDAKYVLGDLTHQTIEEIWNGEPMQRLRAEFIAGDVSNPLCARCEFRPTGPGQVDLPQRQPSHSAA